MEKRISRLGVYEGNSSRIADGYDRESVYVEMNDGCRIAVDLLHPAKQGRRLDGAFPTVLHATPYRRAWIITGRGRFVARDQALIGHLKPGDLATQYEARPIAAELIHQGYNFVSMDIRGSGASFGADFVDHWRTGRDVARVVEWIAAQPWSNSRVGMVGISFDGMVQFFTAAYAPAALACIAPQYPGLIQGFVDGGLAISSFVRTWESLLKGIENEPSAPVDGPDGEALHTEANAGRSPDRYAWMEMFYATPPSQITQLSVFDPYVQETDREDLGLGVVPPFPWQCNRLNAGGIPIYLSTGWWDLTFPGYLIDVFNRLTVPKKLLIGPWNHGQAGDPELLRWFDYWLKGIDTGVMDEPPVHYGASKPSGVTVWKSAPGLPLPEALPSTFYLSPEPSGTISSVNDGTLACSVTSEPVEVKYDVDHSVSLGPLSRHSFYLDDLYINTPGLVARGSKCLTFTTQPLEVDIEITGWPVIDLEITTTSDRGAIVATLENVQADGAVAYMTEGFLNFAHRMERDTNLGYQGPVSRRYLLADLLPVRPGDPMRVRCELYPISSIVRAGDRIRLTLAGADEDNLIVPTMGDDATLSVSLNGDHASRLILPIVNPYMAPTALVVEGAFDGTEEISAFRRPEDPRQGTD